MADERIVVTGLGLVSSMGIGGAAFWASAAAGATGIRNTTRFDTQGLSCHLAGEVCDLDPKAWLPKKGLRNLNRSIIFGRTAARCALDVAGFAGAPPDPGATGVVLGTNGSCTSQMLEFDRDASRGFVDPLMFPNTGVSAPACQISVFEGYHSQTSTLSSGHAAGLEAIAVGAQVLRADEAAVVIAGGVEELCAATYAAAACSGRLYRDDTVTNGHWPGPFSGRGVVPGEGSACLILERAQDAYARQAKVLAEISGVATAFDPYVFAKHEARAEPMIAVIRNALEASGVTPDQVDCVISGAQGDPASDDAEAEALVRVFDGRRVPIVAICSQLGDTHGAMGAFQAAAAVLAIQHRGLAGRAPNPHAVLDLVHGSRPADARVCLLTSFGSLGERIAMVVKAAGAHGTADA
jgi:3-oxoacyl-[acyl-carrier-protein] synthase II